MTTKTINAVKGKKGFQKIKKNTASTGLGPLSQDLGADLDEANTVMEKAANRVTSTKVFQDEWTETVNAGDRYAEHDIRTITPRTSAELKAALKNSRGEGGAGADDIRHVYINREAMGNYNGELEIVPPRDGRPIYVTVESGLPNLVIKSGEAHVVMDSSWGNTLHAKDSARVKLRVGAGRKFRGYATDGGTLDVTAIGKDANAIVSPHYARDSVLGHVTLTEVDNWPVDDFQS